LDLHLELVGDLQAMRRAYQELLWNFNGLKHAQAANELRFGMASIGPDTLTESAGSAIAAAIAEKTQTERALKTMRVFHFQYTIPKERCPECGYQPSTPDPPRLDPPAPNPDHLALRAAADIAPVAS
jgi:hypothetical protein